MPNGDCIMTLELLNKTQLQIINRRNFRYSLDVAEKDYFLALVSKIIYESTLNDKLVFKGGTALHHTYLPQMRFSESVSWARALFIPAVLDGRIQIRSPTCHCLPMKGS